MPRTWLLYALTSCYIISYLCLPPFLPIYPPLPTSFAFFSLITSTFTSFCTLFVSCFVLLGVNPDNLENNLALYVGNIRKTRASRHGEFFWLRSRFDQRAEWRHKISTNDSEPWENKSRGILASKKKKRGISLWVQSVNIQKPSWFSSAPTACVCSCVSHRSFNDKRVFI